MDKFVIYGKAAHFNGKILFLMQIYRSASGGLLGLCPGPNWGLPSPRVLLHVRYFSEWHLATL